MGNTHGRKRKADDDNEELSNQYSNLTIEPTRKKRRLEEESAKFACAEYRNAINRGSLYLSLDDAALFEKGPDQGQNFPRKRRRIGERLSKLFSLSSSKLDDNFINSNLASSLSQQSLSHQNEELQPACNSFFVSNVLASASSISRAVWPTPWAEALFLPEFPNRTAVSEKTFQEMQKSQIIAKEAIEQVKCETKIQQTLGAYTFIARLFFCWQNKSTLFCLQQLATGPAGDLFTNYIHRKQIIYRDLKLENVVVDSDGHILLIDFGLAKVLENGGLTRTICGTLQYMAPEVASEKPYGHWVDWWSMGVLLHILFTNRYPYPNADVRHHSELVFIDYSTPPEATRELGNLFDRLLSKEEFVCSYPVMVQFSPFGSLPWFEDSCSKISDKGSDTSHVDKSFESIFDEDYKDFEYVSEFVMRHPSSS